MAFRWPSARIIGPLVGITLVAAAIALMVATKFGFPPQEPVERPDSRRLIHMELLASAAKCAFAVTGIAPTDKHAMTDTLSGQLPSGVDHCREYVPTRNMTAQDIRESILPTSDVTYTATGP